ncbi:ABC transporter permease [Brevibacterium otitidis]|uniref:ABC transporter permease n=1 Tax=Brevibacterium otitidis TaxID=53364 RepID=A0ABV5X3P3_9MICO|nr:ABC transporter permease [Brevibacterium otitidis]
MFLAFREIKFAKGRFALMAAVVALISVLLIMLSGLTAGLARQSTSAIADLPASMVAFGSGSEDEEVDDPSYTQSRVTTDQVDAWQSTAGVSGAEPLGIVQSRLELDTPSQAAGFAAEPGSGIAPDALRAETIVLSEELATELSAKTGDIVTFGGTELEVAGTMPDEWYSHTPVAWIDLGTWKAITHISDPEVAGTVVLADGTDASAAAADEAAGTVSMTPKQSFAALASYSSENGSLTLIQAFLYGISALVVAAFLSVWTIQRTREIAVVKALGGSTRYVLGDALGQALIVLGIGIIAGGVIGIGAGLGLSSVAPFTVSPATTLLPMAGVIGIGLISAAFAVRRVTRVDPLLALGGN